VRERERERERESERLLGGRKRWIEGGRRLVGGGTKWPKKNYRSNGADLGLDIALLCGIFAEDESGRPRELNRRLD